MKNIAMDDWAVNTINVDEFYNAAEAITTESMWVPDVSSRGLRVEAFEGPIEAPQIAAKCNVPEEVAYDTGEQTKLLISIGTDYHCLRDTAIQSLLSTAKVGGSALGHLTPNDFAQVVNLCLNVAKTNSLVLHRAGKVSAIMSDQNAGYRIMRQPDLLEAIRKNIPTRLGVMDFVEGSVSHNQTIGYFELPTAQAALNKSYNDSIKISGRKVDLMPGFRFTTSDTGMAAATLLPVFRLMNMPRGGSYYPVNKGISVKHLRSTSGKLDGTELFAEKTGELHAIFNDTAETIQRMAQTTITNPLNAYILMTKKADIAQKYAKAGYEDLEIYCGGAPCSAHDIYLSATYCIAEAKKNGVSGSALLAVQDSVAKILGMKWSDYDMPGIVSWSNAA